MSILMVCVWVLLAAFAAMTGFDFIMSTTLWVIFCIAVANIWGVIGFFGDPQSIGSS